MPKIKTLFLSCFCLILTIYLGVDEGGEVKRMADGRVARVTEVIAGSPKSFDDAMHVGFKRASKTLRGITGMRVLEFRVAVENEKITEYRVRMEVIFVLED